MAMTAVPLAMARVCRDVVVGAAPPWVQAKIAVFEGDLRAAVNVAFGMPGPVLRDRVPIIAGDSRAGAVAATPSSVQDRGVETFYAIELGDGRRFDCPETVTVLDAGLEAGMDLPHSCTLGGCGTCRVHLVSGRVTMETDEGLSADEIEAGDILLCVACPRSDLVLEYEEG